MAVRGSCALVLALAGCRFGFDPGASGTGDGAADTPGDPCISALMCDDFEAGMVKPGWFSQGDAGTTIGVVSSRVHGGMYALESVVPMIRDGAYSTLEIRNTPVSTGLFSVREWLYVEPPFDNYDTPIAVYDNAHGGWYVSVDCRQDFLWSLSIRGATGLVDFPSVTGCSGGAWHCIELDYTLASSHADLFVDDVKIDEANANQPAPVFDEFEVGAPRADLDGFHTFIDDVVIGRQHVGCQ